MPPANAERAAEGSPEPRQSRVSGELAGARHNPGTARHASPERFHRGMIGRRCWRRCMLPTTTPLVEKLTYSCWSHQTS